MPSTWFIMWCWTWPRGWGGVCQVYHWKVTLVSPLSTLCSLERSYTICHSHVRSKHLHFTSLRVEHLHKLFWILPHRQFVYSPPSIYLYDYGLMDIYFKLWVIIQYYLFCSNCFHFGQSELSHLTHVPLTHHNHSECRGVRPASVFSTVLLAGTVRRSRIILFMSCLSLTTSHFSTQP